MGKSDVDGRFQGRVFVEHFAPNLHRVFFSDLSVSRVLEVSDALAHGFKPLFEVLFASGL